MLCTFRFLINLEASLVWGVTKFQFLKLAIVLRLKRNYHCRSTDVGEDYDLRVIISKSIGGYIVKTSSSEIVETN